jgi:muramoyltetrapeptide carboxypeptidase
VRKGAFLQGAEFIAGKGFRVTYREDIFSRDGYLAGSDTRRTEELNGHLADPQVKAILLGRGGYGLSRILGSLKLGLFRRRPKIVVGYSDATALLLSLQLRCGAPVFHGPFVTDGKASLARLLAVLRGVRHPLAITGLQPLKSGRVQAPLVGGNLSLLAHSIGTPFEVETRGRILFVEEVSESPYRIDRMVRQLLLAGKFRALRGLLMGRFTGCGAAARRNAENLLLEAVGTRDIPVARSFPAGHFSGNRAFPLGVPALFDTASRSLTFASYLQPAGRG